MSSMSLSFQGILHTVIGTLAILAAIRMLVADKRISYKSGLGKFYLLGTAFTGATALTIFNHGGFNVAHGLAVLTIGAVAAGAILERTGWFGGLNKYAVNLFYSATLLFHALPTATEILTRFPMDAPIASSIKDPLLGKVFLGILIVFLILLVAQMIWLRGQDLTEDSAGEDEA